MFNVPVIASGSFQLFPDDRHEILVFLPVFRGVRIKGEECIPGFLIARALTVRFPTSFTHPLLFSCRPATMEAAMAGLSTLSDALSGNSRTKYSGCRDLVGWQVLRAPREDLFF